MRDRATTRGEPLAVGFVSLGCAKNRVDSQTMAGALLAHGMVLAPDPEAADVVIINTCAFIAAAREESLQTIAEVCGWKARGRCRAVLVAGCLPQRYREQIQVALPEVDGFLGLDALDQVADMAAALAAGGHGLMAVPAGATRLYEPPAVPVVFSAGAYAYLKIAEGCNHHCAFCAIPGIRGRYRSRTVDHIVQEAVALVRQGFRELDLIAQDVTAYGRELESPSSLAGLLGALDTALAGEGGDCWIRLLYGYPTGIDEALLEAMARLPSVLPYLDVPVQHSHPDILRAMRRGGTVEAVAGLARRARAVLPEITLRTTCLTGFPGETEAHVEHLLETLEAAQFDHVGVFTYSPEENTPAFDLPEAPPPEVAEARRDRIMRLQQQISARKGAALLGRRDRFLLDGPTSDPDLWRARSRRQAPEVDGITYLTGLPAGAAPGQFVEGHYTEQADYDMVAQYGAGGA